METKEVLKKIRALRKQKKLSAQEMGDALGVSSQTYFAIESGRKALKLEDYFKICQALNISPHLWIQEGGHKIECQRLAEEIENLPNREYLLLRHWLFLLSVPTEEL